MLHTKISPIASNIVHVLVSALESTSCGVTITDAKKKSNPIVYVNQGFCDLTGYCVDEILGRNCRFLQQLDQDQLGLDQLRQAIVRGVGCKVTVRNYRKDGSLFWNELIVSPIVDGDGDLTHFVGVQNDITEVVRLKQQRDDFVATLVHDLRNPIIGTNRILELIRDGTISGNDQTVFLKKVEESNLTMLRMISNTLDHYRSEAGRLVPVLQFFDMSELCRRVLDGFQLHAASQSVHLQHQYPDSIPVLGDENLLRRVLVNLIDNAIKFTGNEGLVSVRMERSQNLTVRVINTGSQLSREEVEQLFDRFMQTKTGRQHPNGNGLGLFFCRQIIEAHGGTITCQSNAGETEFLFTLPLTH